MLKHWMYSPKGASHSQQNWLVKTGLFVQNYGFTMEMETNSYDPLKRGLEGLINGH